MAKGTNKNLKSEMKRRKKGIYFHDINRNKRLINNSKKTQKEIETIFQTINFEDYVLIYKNLSKEKQRNICNCIQHLYNNYTHNDFSTRMKSLLHKCKVDTINPI